MGSREALGTGGGGVVAGAIKKLIELSAQRVSGQTHPVRNRLAVRLMERRGRGGAGCDLSIVMMDREGERRESSVRRKSAVTRGESGWPANSVTT